MADWRERFLSVAGPGILAGIRYGDWVSLLRANRWAISPRYGMRAQAITMNSLLHTAYSKREERDFLPRVRQAEIQPPIFILGHWRTGTTHLHHLLSTDTRFASPNVYQTSFPHSFLTTEERRPRLLDAMLPRTRSVDNVRQSFDAPNEDEFALCTMTSHSPYMGWVFPRRADHYDRYLTFDGVSEGDRVVWKAALELFMRKLSWKYERPLLLKSPPHTCRIQLLLELFPKARFVHMHRHPFSIFPSTQHTMDVVRRSSCLHGPTVLDWDARIRDRFQQMYDRFFAEKALIPDGQFHEVRYEDLERDPIGQIRTLYERLDLPDFGATESSLRAYVETISSYKKNRFAELPPLLRESLGREWRRYFEEYGYANTGL